MMRMVVVLGVLSSVLSRPPLYAKVYGIVLGCNVQFGIVTSEYLLVYLILMLPGDGLIYNCIYTVKTSISLFTEFSVRTLIIIMCFSCCAS